MEKEAERLANLKLHNAKMAEKRAPGKSGTPVIILTNLRELLLKKNVNFYKHDINIKYYYSGVGGEKAVEVSKSTKTGSEKDRDLEKCLEAYKKVATNPQFKGGNFVYDRQANIYGIETEIKGAENGLEFELDGKGNSFKESSLIKIVVKIAKVGPKFQATSNEINKTVNECPGKADRTLLEALNAIISSPAYSDDNIVTLGACTHYFINPLEAGFDKEDVMKFEMGKKQSSMGISKAVKTLEGNGKEKSLFVVASLRTTLFHEDNTSLLVKLASCIGGGKEINPKLTAQDLQAQNMLKHVHGTQVYTTYGKNGSGGAKLGRIYKIKGFGLSASKHKFEDVNKKTITMLQYFDKEFGIKLKYPDLFTIKTEKPNVFIPVELLAMCSSQTVRNEQMAHGEQEKMIRHSALKPDQRVRLTDLAARQAGLVPSQPIAGVVDIKRDCVEVTGRRLPAVAIQFNQLKTTNEDRGKVGAWSKGRGTYFKPATIQKWEFHIIEENISSDFISAFVGKCRTYGIRISDPVVKVHGRYNGDFESIFIDAKKNGVQLLFFIIRDQLNLHQKMKVLEQQYQIVTQEVRGTTAVRKFGAQTQENVINKINMKMGGLNYEVGAETNQPRRLFIGFETAQRNAGTGLPVVSVGYAANTLAHPQEYAGGYVFVQKDRDNTDIYGPIIKQVIERAVVNMQKSRNVSVGHIFIYFNGVSDGQYPLVASEYVEEIMNGCRALGVRPHLTVLAVNKTHNERLVLKSPKGYSNPAPGTVIDTKIVSAVHNEFYLTAATAFQGTSKTPKYALVFDSANCPMDKLEEVSFELCHLHEIVQSTVSLPAPLVIADRYSKRGACVLANRGLSQEEMMDEATINARYTYEGRALEGRRFNA